MQNKKMVFRMTIKIEFDDVNELKEFIATFFPTEVEEVDVPLEEIQTPVEIEVPKDPVISPVIDFEKVFHYGKYRYDIGGCYFKTKKGKSGRILITGSEALQIIPLIQQGKSDKEIFDIMMSEHNGFFHDKGTMHNTATISTITTFRKRYDAMELNNAIRFYCNNSRVLENPLDYVKLPAFDERELEVEDLWH